MKAVFAIRPRFAKLILSGEKACEYRRRLPARDVSSIAIYATSPVSKIVGEVRVEDTLLLEKEELWLLTARIGGISKSEFDGYFHGVRKAGALFLSRPVFYERPLTIEEVGLTRPPQSFCYLNGEDG